MEKPRIRFSKAKSQNGQHNEEKVQNAAFALTPKIWLKVFAKLKDPQILNCNSSFKNYNNILNCSRVCFLFSIILKETKPEWLFSEVIPIIFLYLEPKDLRKCRQVCRMWKFGVDHFLEYEHDYFRLIASHDLTLKRFQMFYDSFGKTLFEKLSVPWEYRICQTTCTIWNSKKIQELLANLSSANICTLPGRRLRLNWNRILQRDILKFLKSVGTSLRVLHMKLPLTTEFTQSYYCNLIKNILSLTPNLRVLHITTKNRTTSLSATETWKYAPSLPFLQVVKFESMWHSNIPYTLHQCISQPYLCQLKTLCLSFASYYLMVPLWTPKYLPKLETLQLRVSNAMQLYSMFSEQSEFPKLSFVHIVISSGDDKIRKESHVIDAYLSYYLEPLLKFAKTLKTIHLSTSGNDVRTFASQRDVCLIRRFKVLENLCINNFSLHNLKVLKSIPQSVQCLALSVYHFEKESCYERIWYHLSYVWEIYGPCALWYICFGEPPNARLRHDLLRWNFEDMVEREKQRKRLEKYGGQVSLDFPKMQRRSLVIRKKLPKLKYFLEISPGNTYTCLYDKYCL